MAGWGRGQLNDSLALRRNADEPETGAGGNREDT